MLGADGHGASRVAGAELVARPLLTLLAGSRAHRPTALGDGRSGAAPSPGCRCPWDMRGGIASLSLMCRRSPGAARSRRSTWAAHHRNRRHDTPRPHGAAGAGGCRGATNAARSGGEPARVRCGSSTWWPAVRAAFALPVVVSGRRSSRRAPGRRRRFSGSASGPRDVPRSGVAALVCARTRGRTQTLAPRQPWLPPHDLRSAGTRLRLETAYMTRTARLVMAIVQPDAGFVLRQGIDVDDGCGQDRVAQVVESGRTSWTRRDQGCAGARDRRDRGEAAGQDFVAWVRGEFPDLVISVDTWRSEMPRRVCGGRGPTVNDA